jgi:hypothetical protein
LRVQRYRSKAVDQALDKTTTGKGTNRSQPAVTDTRRTLLAVKGRSNTEVSWLDTTIMKAVVCDYRRAAF